MITELNEVRATRKNNSRRKALLGIWRSAVSLLLITLFVSTCAATIGAGIGVATAAKDAVVNLLGVK